MANKPKFDGTGEAGINTYPQSSTATHAWSDDELTVPLNDRVVRLEQRLAALEAALAKALDMCTPPAIEVMPSPEGYYYKCLSCGNVGAEIGKIHHSPNCPAGRSQAVDAD